jgi:hypothetical protein
MSAFIPQDSLRSPFFRKPWVRFLNGAGEVIPPFSVMRITNETTSNGETIYNVAKPDSTYRWRYLVNGPIAVGSEATHEGWGTFLGEGGWVRFGSGTPALNEMWGPTSGQWYLTQHRPGFLVNGANTYTHNSLTSLNAIQVIPGEIRVQNDDGGGSLAAGAGGRTFGVYGGAAGTTDTSLEVTLTNASSAVWAASKYGTCTIDMGGLIFGVPLQT